MSDTSRPLDSALDLFVFVPVGFAVTAAEELPKLAAKGRRRVEQQMAVARIVGQFAVARSRQEVGRRFTRGGEPIPGRQPTQEAPDSARTDSQPATTEEAPSAGESPRSPDTASPSTQAPGTEPLGGQAPGTEPLGGQAPGTEPLGDPQTGQQGGAVTQREVDAATVAEAAGDAPAGPSPAADSLAIPGYDSLSASQVVQRLAGLSEDELAAVGAYEAAHRARQTVLTRVSQLQIDRD